MTARKCFTGKMAAGRIAQRAGTQILDMLDGFEREHQGRLGDGAALRQAALDTVEAAKLEASRQADLTRRSLIAQSNVLRAVNGYKAVVDELRRTGGDFGFGNKAPPTLGKETQSALGFAVRSLLARDPWEIATWNNVNMLARQIRGEAHRQFAQAIEFLRPKKLGLANETTRELDVLRALYGDTGAPAEAQAAAKAFSQVAEDLRNQHTEAGGNIPERKTWRLPNPELEAAKVKAAGADAFKQFVRERVDRADMLDHGTGKPLTDARFEQLLDEAYNTITSEGLTGPPTGQARGRKMLANDRDAARFFVWKDAENWHQVAEAFGAHDSPYHTMISHIAAMSDDIAMMRVLGPNPEATKRFIADLFKREPAGLMVTAATGTKEDIAAAAKTNKRIETRVRTEQRLFDDLYSEVSGANRVPVNTTLARTMADTRHYLSSTQLGSALISSFSDAGTLLMISRFNGLPAARVLARAVGMMGEKGSEIFAAQQGLVADTLAHQVGTVDRIMGETVRSGFAAKLSSANIRLSGLRRWTGVLRSAFGLEMMAHVARERGKLFRELDPQFRSTLERYGIGEADWRLIAAAEPHEPRPNALLTRPVDVAEGGTAAHQAAGEKLMRIINTEMDYAVIENDPVTRALMIGDSRPGTAGGELRRTVGMYRGFPTTFMAMHFARATARGWDGSRLSHAALTFLAATLFGALSMQVKELNAGRDPLNLNPTEANGLRGWGKAILQGGGLGAFGDIVFVDKTKQNQSWASIMAGPVMSTAEKVLGDFILKNVVRASKGEQTHWAGDAVYAGASLVPGSSLWYAKLAFQRAVVDQAARIVDPRAPERFHRMEQQAQKDFGQKYWLPPGRTEPRRAPEFGAMLGRQ